MTDQPSIPWPDDITPEDQQRFDEAFRRLVLVRPQGPWRVTAPIRPGEQAIWLDAPPESEWSDQDREDLAAMRSVITVHVVPPVRIVDMAGPAEGTQLPRFEKGL